MERFSRQHRREGQGQTHLVLPLRHDAAFRRWQSRQANRIRNWISQETINDSACSLKLYRRHCLEGIQLYSGMHRFMPTLVKMRGYTVIEVPVKRA